MTSRAITIIAFCILYYIVYMNTRIQYMNKYLLSIIIMIIIIKFQNCIVSFILDFVSLPCRILFYLFVICILNLRYSVECRYRLRTK